MFNINETITTGKYIAVPHALYTNPKYAEVDDTAKIVYSFLISRLRLSQQNAWYDKDGNLYCKASVRELAKSFNTSKSCISRKLIALEKVGLISRRQIGWCNADLIFPNKIEDIEDNESDDDSQNDFSRCPAVPPSDPNLGRDVPQMRPNNINNTIKENNNVKQQHNIESTNGMYTQEQEDSSDVDVVMSTLNSFGFVKSLAVRAIKQYGVRRVREAIEIMRSQIDTVRNKAAFIYSALKNNYQLTKKQENTTPIVQIVTESDSEVALAEDRSNHTSESISTPCEPSIEKYAVQPAPSAAVDVESPEKVDAMKDWIERVYNARGSVIRPLQKWMEDRGLMLDGNGKVTPVPAV